MSEEDAILLPSFGFERSLTAAANPSGVAFLSADSHKMVVSTGPGWCSFLPLLCRLLVVMDSTCFWFMDFPNFF